MAQRTGSGPVLLGLRQVRQHLSKPDIHIWNIVTTSLIRLRLRSDQVPEEASLVPACYHKSIREWHVVTTFSKVVIPEPNWKAILFLICAQTSADLKKTVIFNQIMDPEQGRERERGVSIRFIMQTTKSKPQLTLPEVQGFLGRIPPSLTAGCVTDTSLRA